MESVHQIIGKINSDYAENKGELLKEYKTWDKVPVDKIKGKPLEQHTIVYDSSSETLEPIYFYILDLMGDMAMKPEKLVDNFTSSPGSGHFSELGQRATVMQQQATRILGDINNVMRSILNLVYDLKEFKIRLATYYDLKSQNKETREAALLSLKQLWMDKVDINKGNSSIKGIAVSGQIGYQTLIDAFLFVENEKAVDSVDLNDRIKRIVKQRIHEFNLWLVESEKELRKRYELERKYLKSQVNSVKIYARWAKPYLRAAQQLEMGENFRSASIVKVFNTILLELTLLGKQQLKIDDAIVAGKLSEDFLKLRKRGLIKRDYFSCYVVEFVFRGIPTKTSVYQQHYVFGGRVEITFSAYALNNDELKKLDEEITKSEVGDALKLVEGATGSIEDLQNDIDMFLKEEEKAEAKEKGKSQELNPFAAILGFYEKKEAKTEKATTIKSSKLKSDSFIEKILRKASEDTAKETVYTLFDVYKKGHNMPSYEERK